MTVSYKPAQHKPPSKFDLACAEHTDSQMVRLRLKSAGGSPGPLALDSTGTEGSSTDGSPWQADRRRSHPWNGQHGVHVARVALLGLDHLGGRIVVRDV